MLKLGDIIKLSHSYKISTSDMCLVYNVDNEFIQVFSLATKVDLNSSINLSIEKRDLRGGTIPQNYFIEINKLTLINQDCIEQKVAEINKYKIDELLRHMAYILAEKHYLAIHENEKKFNPGETYIHYAGRVYDSNEIKMLIDSSFDFWLTTGRFAKRFEEEFSSFLGSNYCILTNSGSSANLLAISALTSPKLGKRRLRQGDEVITTACSFPTTINPIIQNGLIPVFLDVDVGTYNVEVNDVENAISKKTKAIFLAHTLGNPFNLDKILEVCKEHNLWLIEDNCDALGSKYNGKYTGSFGDIATFSFYPAHHITMGEGGALVTNDSLLRSLIISFRDWGRDCWCEPGYDNTCGKRFKMSSGSLPYGYDHKYTYSHIGYNLKLTEMQAAIGLAQLKKLPAFIAARKKNYEALEDGLSKYENYFVLPRVEQKADPSWFGFILSTKKDSGFTRDAIVQYLEDNRIATRMLFAGNIIRHPCFDYIKYRSHGSLENSDLIMNNAFWIGVYPGITPGMVSYIIEKIHDFIKSR